MSIQILCPFSNQVVSFFSFSFLFSFFLFAVELYEFFMYFGISPLSEVHASFIFFNKFIYLFLAALGLHCCARAFSSCGEWGPLFVAVRGLLIAVASRCGARALGAWASVVVACGLQSAGSVVVAHRFSCSVACEIFPDQGSNPCPLHWQEDS